MESLKFKKGNTYILKVDMDLTDIEKVVFVLNDITKTYKSDGTGDVTEDDGTILIPLTQQETLSLAKTTEIEIEVKFTDGEVSRSDIYTTTSLRTLLNEAI